MDYRLKKGLLLATSLLMISTSAFAKKSVKPAQKKKLSEPHTILFHDNCPKTTAALNEEVSLKATIPGYKGTISVTYKTWPEEKHSYPLTGFYDCCERIRSAMEKSKGTSYILHFNTKPDMSGMDVQLSNPEQATYSATLLIENQETEVYAFYHTQEEYSAYISSKVQSEIQDAFPATAE